MKPTIGRTVHFNTCCRTCAAIITGLVEPATIGADNVVNLHVMPSGGPAHELTAVPFSEEPAEGHWSWPPRV